MAFLLVSLGIFFVGGCVALALGRGQNASRIGAFSAIAASFAAFVPIYLLFTNASYSRLSAPLTLTLGKLPMGEFALRLDPLSAIFLLPVLILVAVAAFYGMGHGDGSEHAGEVSGHAGAHWFFYNLLAGGMVLTLTSDNAFLFLLAWEIMSVAPFFLITLNDSSSQTRSAAWIYLVAAHLGALFLLAFFTLLSAKNGGSLSFALFMANAANLEPGILGGSGLLFILALVGFGAKTGFMPLHVWLPEAHPAAPSHVSAVMSGAMIKMGVYGIIRTFAFIGTGDTWWAHTLMFIGAFTAALGILQALAQPTIKRALAFSSVENMGIICLGLGVALLCLQNNHTGAAALAATGVLMHTVNHSMSKGLLFLCAGCVFHGTGTVTMRFLGGLQKRMPLVGWCFVLGSAAIAALPPLNGFAGEFFIYLSMVFSGTAFAHGMYPEYSLIFWFCLVILAGVGGFTLFCFARIYGMTFLGAARTEYVSGIHTPSHNESAAIILMACFCVFSALASPRVAKICHLAVTPAFHTVYEASPVLAAAESSIVMGKLGTLTAPTPKGFTPPRFASGYGETGSAIGLLQNVNNMFMLFSMAVLAVILFRRRILRGRTTGESPTWDCGYLAPTAKMQYTPDSFSRPATRLMRTFLRQKFERPVITEYFPIKAKAVLTSADWIETKGFDPLFSLVSRVADKCKELQHGRSNGYILYILVTLVALLAWKVR